MRGNMKVNINGRIFNSDTDMILIVFDDEKEKKNIMESLITTNIFGLCPEGVARQGTMEDELRFFARQVGEEIGKSNNA